MKMPNLKDITPVLTKVGTVGGGLVVAHVGRQALMGTDLLKRDTPIIKDTVATNGAAVAVSVIGAVLANQLLKSSMREHVVLACAGAGSYFLIRTINKLTDGLNGLGETTEKANSIKDFLNKIIPRLDGLGNVASTTSAAEWQRMLDSYQAPVPTTLPVQIQRPAGLYGNVLQVA